MPLSKRRRVALLASVAASMFMLPRDAHAWFILPPLVFDAQKFMQRVQDVTRQAEEIARLREQIENDLRLLASTNVTTIDGWRGGFERLHDALARLDLKSRTDANGDLGRRYPIDWTGSPADDARFQDARYAWVESQRSALGQVRAAQNASASDMAAASDRVGRLVGSSNDAPGLTTALQARTQLNAELSNEIAKLQAMQDARAFARAERDGAIDSSHAFSTATAAWLNRRGTVQTVSTGPGGYAVAPVPETAAGGAR